MTLLYLCMAPPPNFLAVSQLILSTIWNHYHPPSWPILKSWKRLGYHFPSPLPFINNKACGLIISPLAEHFPNWFSASSYFIPPGLILHMAAEGNLHTSHVWSVHDEYNTLMLLMSVLLLFNGYGVSLVSCLYYWPPFPFLFFWARMAYWLTNWEQELHESSLASSSPCIWKQMASDVQQEGSPWILCFCLQAPRASCPARLLAGWVRTCGSRMQ